MFFTIFVLFCRLIDPANAQSEVCDRVVITDSSRDDLTEFDCGRQDKIADFIKKNPRWARWRIAQYGCVKGNKPPLDNLHDKA